MEGSGHLPPRRHSKIACASVCAYGDHNLYLEALAEQGLAGFFSLTIMLLYVIVSSYRVLLKPQFGIRLLNLSILASLIAFCVAAIFELSLWRQWVTLLLSALMGLAAFIHTYVTMKGKS